MPETQLPRRILLATDLSGRCDRALARAAELAGAWGSELHVVHVVSEEEVAHRDRLSIQAPAWRRPGSWVHSLERALRAELAAEGITATSRVIIGTPMEALPQAVIDEGAGLVVLGISKDARMDRIQLGSTADALVRHSRVPILNVRGRARAAYRYVVVASDFSEPSLHALQVAARWFAGSRITLFHAYASLDPAPDARSGEEDASRAAVVRQCDRHLADSSLPAPFVAGLQRVIECGTPQALLSDYVPSSDVDLVVLGSHGRSGLTRALLGSTAENLLHALDCDTLVVRGA